MDPQSFLADVDKRPLIIPDARGLEPVGLFLGRGPNALEVAVVQAQRRPTAADLRAAWHRRLGGRASPLLLVAFYDDRVAICGPTGDPPYVIHDLFPQVGERICRAALSEPDRHAALRFLQLVVPEAETPLLGLRNEGLLATHELQTGVLARGDWTHACERARTVTQGRGLTLLSTLGYTVESLPGPVSILRAAGTRVAVAVLLEHGEMPESVGPLFSGVSPVAYAMAIADRERVPYVLMLAGPVIRLYTARHDIGVGRRGRTETFIEARLDLIPDHQLGYLWLLFSADALRDEGPFEQILASSADYAADLGARIRDRIYKEVVPGLSKALAQARGLSSPTPSELAETYQMALTLLFRTLCVAYAEDKGLLPYRSNQRYRDRSLKQKARELLAIVESGRPFDPQVTHWEDLFRLFRAMDLGSAEWGIPQYNGGLFSRDPDVSPTGAKLELISLPNPLFGPALAKLLVDETPDGHRGPVDFRSLGVREFGTIYEGLLESELSVAEVALTVGSRGEYLPIRRPSDPVVVARGEIYLHNQSGARKATGSYFTKQFAVEHLLEHTLQPALDAHVSRLDLLDDRGAADAFFNFRVADIAMGSGHFLVAAVDRIEKALSGYLAKRPLPDTLGELARLRKTARDAMGALGEGVEIDDTQLLRRQIARRCVYGVDLNPLAVELAKLSLWIYTFVPGLPLSFLDRNLVVGNSLIGIGTITEADGLLREIHRTGAGELFVLTAAAKQMEEASTLIAKLARLSDATAAEIEQARHSFRDAQVAVAPVAALFDVLTAARIDAKVRDLAAREISHWSSDPTRLTQPQAAEDARGVLEPMPPFHFPIAFPEVFRRATAGFDVIVGNPPWEKAKVEEDAFWVRFLPGLIRGMTQAEKEAAHRKVRRDRPDLVRLYEREAGKADLLRRVLLAQSFPGMGAGDPDLYKAFIWRFWQLTRQDSGRIGVVLPRLVFSGSGGAEFRAEILRRGKIIDLTTLENKRQWVFPDVHPQMSIALCSFQHDESGGERTIPLRGPFFSEKDYREALTRPVAHLPVGDVMTWTDTAAIPVLPRPDSLDVFMQLRKAPRVDLNDGTLRVRPHRELDARNDKHLMKIVDRRPRGYWPVFAGESFGLWEPDTGICYAWADPQTVQEALQEKRLRSARLTSSAFSEFPQEVITNPSTLPCLRPRIAFRDITKATNRRTVIASLIPPRVFLQHTAPYLVRVRGDESDEAYLLGILCSIPLDWYARRFTEVHLSYDVFNPLPLPRPPRNSRLRLRVVAITGQLAAQDARFVEWANAIRVKVNPLKNDEKQTLICELDAVAAHLYGLAEDQLRYIFETFHEAWDYEDHLRATLTHYNTWKQKL